jgi:hypothetical protein
MSVLPGRPGARPCCDTVKLCARVEAVHARLRDEGLPLAMGISTLADGVAELPRAYEEAHSALECVAAEGGVAALPRLSPFDYLALSAPETARRLVDPELRIEERTGRNPRRVDDLIEWLVAIALEDGTLSATERGWPPRPSPAAPPGRGARSPRA